jgi:hypothetical protein
VLSRVKRLENHDEIMELTVDARVVALRWDLAPWGLVVDLDTPVSEARRAPVRRAWLIFSGLGDLTWPLQSARVPNGCWVTTPIMESPAVEKMRVFSFFALLPQFDEADRPPPNPSAEITITALSIDALVSTGATPPGPHGPSWSERTALATDLEFIEAAKELF